MLRDSFGKLSRVEQIASVFLILGFILLNATFWKEHWSVSDSEVNTLKSICFDKGEDRCCQTFEDRHETVPGTSSCITTPVYGACQNMEGWIQHSINLMIAAYFFAIFAFVPLIVGFFTEFQTKGKNNILIGTTCISSLVTALCLLIVVGLFNENYDEVKTFKDHRRGLSFFMSIPCIMIYLLVPLLILVQHAYKGIKDKMRVHDITSDSRFPHSSTFARTYEETVPREIQPIVVKVAPKVKLTSREYKAKAGDDLTITCTIETNGNLKQVNWKKIVASKMKTLNMSLPRYNQESALASSFTIQNLKPSDTGTYQCSATNEHGTGKSKDIPVQVLFPPTIKCVDKDYTGEINFEMILECNIKACPKPIIKWQKFVENEWKDINLSDSRYTVNLSCDNGSLYIDDLLYTDAGKYICVAINELGRATSEEMNIIVQYPPRVLATKTEYSGRNGSVLLIESTINACPDLTKVYWVTIANGETEEIIMSDIISFINSSTSSVCQINRLTPHHTGIYQCIAENDIGIGKSNPVSVKVTYSPIVTCEVTNYINFNGDALELVVCVQAMPAISRIHWERVVNNEFQEVNTSSSKYYCESPLSPYLKITGLEPSDEGIYKCFVENDIGTGISPEISITVNSSETEQRHQQHEQEGFDVQISQEDRTLCTVCFDNPKEVIFLGCQHRACCESCANEIMNVGNRQCPICRAPIVQMIKPFDV